MHGRRTLEALLVALGLALLVALALGRPALGQPTVGTPRGQNPICTCASLLADTCQQLEAGYRATVTDAAAADAPNRCSCASAPGGDEVACIYLEGAWAELGAGGPGDGLGALVDDPAPELGNDLDAAGFDVLDAGALELAQAAGTGGTLELRESLDADPSNAETWKLKVPDGPGGLSSSETCELTADGKIPAPCLETERRCFSSLIENVNNVDHVYKFPRDVVSITPADYCKCNAMDDCSIWVQLHGCDATADQDECGTVADPDRLVIACECEEGSEASPSACSVLAGGANLPKAGDWARIMLAFEMTKPTEYDGVTACFDFVYF